MPIESQETMAGLPSEVATQVAKVSPPNRSRTRRPIIIGGAILLSAGFACWIYSGINSRVNGEKGLEKTVKLTSAAVVNVVHPTSGSDAQAIELPGNTQAFTDAPIYARTSGYLKQWYFDICARVPRGEKMGAGEGAPAPPTAARGAG